LWTESHEVTICRSFFDLSRATRASFEVLLGSINPLDLTFDEDYWIEVTEDTKGFFEKNLSNRAFQQGMKQYNLLMNQHLPKKAALPFSVNGFLK